MPFKSKAQQKFMFANHPAIAKEFAAATPNIAALPMHVAISNASKNRKPKIKAKQKKTSY